MNNWLGIKYCALLRRLGNGRHKWRSGICTRCGTARQARAKRKEAREGSQP